MSWRRQTKCTEVCVAVALLLALHWTQIEASLLKKNIKQDGQKEATDMADGFQQGIIVFGDPKNASAEVDPSFQADYQGSAMKDAFSAMGPYLKCGNKQMRFTAFGKSVGHFTLKQKPPLPLSKVPPACGYTIEGFPYRLVLHVPYDGCNIDVEGGYYNLPLLWNGYTVKLMCPKPDITPTVPPFFPWPFLPTTTAAPEDPVPPHFHLPFPPFFPYPWPTTPTTTPAPQDPVPPHFHPLYFYYLYWLYYRHQIPFPSAPTTSPDPQDPFMYLYHIHKFPYSSLPLTPPAADSLPQVPQKYFQQYPYLQFPQQLPHGPKYPPNPYDPHKTTPASTTMYCPWCSTATP